MDDLNVTGAQFDTVQELALAVRALFARAEAAELELSQERFMRTAAEAEVERLREQVAALQQELAALASADDMFTTRVAVHVGEGQLVAACGDKAAIDKLAKDLIELVSLREELAALEHATCSCCDRPVNRRIDAVVCDWCYEERLT